MLRYNTHRITNEPVIKVALEAYNAQDTRQQFWFAGRLYCAIQLGKAEHRLSLILEMIVHVKIFEDRVCSLACSSVLEITIVVSDASLFLAYSNQATVIPVIHV